MSDLLSEPKDKPETPEHGPPKTVALWSPTFILVISFFLSYLAGMALACINWYRMGMKRKTQMNVITAVLILAILILSADLISYATGPAGLIVNFGISLYLKTEMERDIDALKGKIIPAQASTGKGILIGMLALAATIINLGSILLVSTLLGIL